MPNIISILKNNLRCQFENESLMLDSILVPNFVRPFENTLSSFNVCGEDWNGNSNRDKVFMRMPSFYIKPKCNDGKQEISFERGQTLTNSKLDDVIKITSFLSVALFIYLKYK